MDLHSWTISASLGHSPVEMDLRLEDISLPEVGPDDVQVKIISDSVCMSTYKAAVEGAEHKRVPDDVAEHPCAEPPQCW